MRTPAMANTPVTLVGRDRELAVLRQHLDASLAGQGTLVLISGEAGIGKTTLAEAISWEAGGRGALVLTGRCYDLAETPAYGPWLYLFDRYPAAADVPPPPTFAVPGTIGEVTNQSALFRQVRDFLKDLTTQQTAILLLDDLHWADQASLDLVRFLAQSVATLPLLMLVTYRSDELTRRHPLYHLLPTLVRESGDARLDLRPLDDAAIRKLVAARYRLAGADTDRLLTYLQVRAEGNAFFLGELLRALEESGVLRFDGAAWTLGDLRHTGVPQLLRQVIDARLSRMDQESQRLLSVAAVIGHEVPLDFWANVGDVDEETLFSTVERALDARLLAEMPDGQCVQFAHALVRVALYEGVPAIRRRRIHPRVAEALASLASPDPDAVAYHFRQAGDARAISWLMQAGDRAWRAQALATARDRYQTALALAEQGSAGDIMRGWLLFRLMQVEFPVFTYRDHLDAAAAIAAVTADPVFAAAFQFYRGFMDFHAVSVHQGLREMEAGVAAIDVLAPDDRDRLDALVRDHIVNHGNIPHTTLVAVLDGVGRFADAMAMGERLVDRARMDPDDASPASIAYTDLYTGLARTYAHLGRVAEAQTMMNRTREAYRNANIESRQVANDALQELTLVALPYQTNDIERRRQLATRADTVFRRYLAEAGNEGPSALALPLLLVEGEWDSAWTIAESTLAPLSEVNRLEPTLSMRVAWGWLARERGELAVACEQVRILLPAGMATEPGSVLYRNAVRTILLAAMLCLDTDDLPNAEGWLTLHDRFLAFSGTVLDRSEGYAAWSRYWLSIGDAEHAYRHAQQALTHATEPRQPLALIAAHRLLGELDTAAGRHADAVSHLNEALALAEACQTPYDRALTLLAIAKLRAAKGEHTEATRLLDDVHAICAPLGAKPALARADALAARLAAPARSGTPVFPAGLTAREVDVLRLVATGLMNAEIAERLFLSERTVEQHLRSIYNKLGSSSRTAATRFAVEHHLT